MTPENFIKVLTGDKEGMRGVGTDKVLESTEKDNLFVFFSDHGYDNLIAFPRGHLLANELMSTIRTMHDKKLYNKLIFYIESCYSGSMFEGLLPSDLNVYATTAANAHESSWGYYCEEDAKVNGTLIGSCLGDEYSIRWMEHTESIEDLTKVTLQEQFETVKKLTLKSHVMQYGDLKIAEEPLSDYQGQTSTIMDYFLGWFKEPVEEMDTKEYKRIKSEDIKLHYLKFRAQTTNDVEDFKAYIKEVNLAARSESIFELFKNKYNLPEQRTNAIDYDCLKQSLIYYEQFCGLDYDRDHKYLNYFSTFCSLNISPWEAYRSLQEICSNF